MNRRGFITGLGLMLAAPAIVRASSLMPGKAVWSSTPNADALERLCALYARQGVPLVNHTTIFLERAVDLPRGLSLVGSQFGWSYQAKTAGVYVDREGAFHINGPASDAKAKLIGAHYPNATLGMAECPA